jgi:hypothetical protein
MNVTINGKEYTVGSELDMRYGNGKQRVRIREITKRGGVKLDRLYGGQHWTESNTTLRPDDDRFL